MPVSMKIWEYHEVPRQRFPMAGAEFLTHQTTCTSEMLEKTPSENYCQKGPPVSGGTPRQATRGTCRLGHRRHVAGQRRP
jgi:hypothetical protein